MKLQNLILICTIAILTFGCRTAPIDFEPQDQPCTPQWNCTSWNDMCGSTGFYERDCRDLNNCKDTRDMPALQK
ncbi:MAG: hypothetical protein ACOCWQ_04980, partial [Nanoarchaeota archaeon]